MNEIRVSSTSLLAKTMTFDLRQLSRKKIFPKYTSKGIFIPEDYAWLALENDDMGGLQLDMLELEEGLVVA